MKFTVSLLSLLALPHLSLSQTSPNCAPTDINCFVTQAQYTVLGTVRSNNIGVGDSVAGTIGTAANYNATIQIQCVFASTDTKMNSGANILGKDVLVTGFGKPKAGCAANTGPEAVANTSQIFFLHVANSPPLGTTPIMRVFDICTGGIPFDNAGAAAVGKVLSDNPQYGFYGSARGPAQCTQPGIPDTPAQPSVSTVTGLPDATNGPSPAKTGGAAEGAKWGVAAVLGGAVAAVAAAFF